MGATNNGVLRAVQQLADALAFDVLPELRDAAEELDSLCAQVDAQQTELEDALEDLTEREERCAALRIERDSALADVEMLRGKCARLEAQVAELRLERDAWKFPRDAVDM